MEVLASEALAEQRFNKQQRLYDDTTTWLAEALDGNMRTHFEFSFDGNDLFGQDGGSMKTIFKDALQSAEDLPPNLGFEWRRRSHELDEYNEMVQMMKGSGFNTMVVVSDFPPELMDATQDTGGYNYQRKQTMLRVITKNDSGLLGMTTQSLDKSDRRALESIYHYFGVQAFPGELLGQRLCLDLDHVEQTQLIDNLVDIYDNTLAQNYGGRWRAGRDIGKSINTYEFVKQQYDLIEYYSNQANFFGDNQPVLYGVMATIKRRFENTKNQNVGGVEYNNSQNLDYEIRLSIIESHLAGNSFSGCGLSLNNANDTSLQLGELGYGNNVDKKQSYSFNKKMYCVVCQAPPKKNDESKKMCGPCGICRSCDSKLQSKI